VLQVDDVPIDAETLNSLLMTLTPAQEKALRLAYGIGCERPHRRWEIALEFREEHGYSSRRISNVIREGDAAVKQLLGADYKRELARHRGLRALLQTPDPREVAEVLSASQRLIDESKLDRTALLSLSPRQFEELIAEIWSRLGYSVELTVRTRDGGRDVIAVKRAEAEVCYLIECKRYDPQYKIGVRFVRALYGVKDDERATKAFLATTSTFTRDALTFFNRHRWELEPCDYEGVAKWIQLAKARQSFQGSRLWVPDPNAAEYRNA
jgi:hypothetical protein